MSCISTPDPQLVRLADAIAQRVGQQRFHVWFNNSTRLDLRQDSLEIAVPNDFISEWIGSHFKKTIQDAAHEVLGCSLPVRFHVVPQLFEAGAQKGGNGHGNGNRGEATNSHGRVNGVGETHGNGHAPVADHGGSAPAATLVAPAAAFRPGGFDGRGVHSDARSGGVAILERAAPASRRPALSQPKPRLRHDLESFIVGQSNQLAFNAATYVAEFPGVQYNPLFIHGACGLGKTHLLQGLCKRFVEHHPTKRWMYLTGEEFTNDFLVALRERKLDTFRRKVRDLDLLVIDDVHFLSGKKATQEEFLHTFNAIEATGRQVVMASDHHPKMIEEFGESLINRFVSGMVVRVDPPNFATRCEILKTIALRLGMALDEEVIHWIARRVTQNVRELEGAVTRIVANVKLTGQRPSVEMVQQAMGDLDRQLIAPVRPESILAAVCNYFALEMRDLMSGRRQRTISLARSMAMFLIRRAAKLSFPEIGVRMGKRNHSTVISACRRMERALEKNERLAWSSAVGEREEEAGELVQRLEELSRTIIDKH